MFGNDVKKRKIKAEDIRKLSNRDLQKLKSNIKAQLMMLNARRAQSGSLMQLTEKGFDMTQSMTRKELKKTYARIKTIENERT